MRGFARPGASVVIIPEPDCTIAPLVRDMLTSQGIESVVRADLPDGATAVIVLSGLMRHHTAQSALRRCNEVFRVARAFAPNSANGAFVSVTDTGGDLGMRGSKQPWLGALAGLVKTADLEWENTDCKALDLACGDQEPLELARKITDELLKGGPEVEVALGLDGRRRTVRSFSEPVDITTLPALNVLVCSGGARGVTAHALRRLAERSDRPPAMALFGRTALGSIPECCVGLTSEAEIKRALILSAKESGTAVKPAEIGRQARSVLAQREIEATLASLRALGAEAAYWSVDVGDHDQVAKALENVRERWGVIDGVVHAAGVVADKSIVDKTDEQYARVMGPKVDGAEALLAATAEDPLKALVFFSSVAGRTGNVGQCDYAMANEVLNKLAAREQARRPQCVVKSLNWGPWEAGMVTPALKRYFESHGVPLIDLDSGADMFVDELADRSRERTEVVLGGAPKRASIAGGMPKHQMMVCVDERSAPYLGDHRIDGTVVLPMVQVLEWFTRAAEALHPGQFVTQCSRLRVLRGVPLNAFDREGQWFIITAEPVSSSFEGTLQMRMTLADPTQPAAPNYSALLTLDERLHNAPTDCPSPPQTGTTLDETPYESQLFHGPKFQVIRHVGDLSDEGLRGALDTTEHAGWTGPFRTDPAALDGGLQLALLWARHRLGGDSLPTEVGVYERYSTESKGPLQCTLTGQVEGPRAVSNIEFRDARGHLVAKLGDVQTHRRP